MYTRTERWAAHCFKKFDFEEELADGTLFEGETWWILEESPERTTTAVLSSLGDDGGRGCSDTEVANYEKVGHDCGNGAKALDSTEKTIEGTRKKTINWDLDGKDWFLFGEIGANYASSFLTLNCWLRCGTILAEVIGWVVPYGRRL
ncbi:hypothetical protein AVEN_128156-1 [Araneus ventricosus]|uniref:Uncharacterized protein n=1 Tax=Araneus ventricosus TaxID=182803 RepID=A0A4Y1ZZZ5_ARAVE|nr:hypothetical protein AVEN_128156-1 [Araneus ventricosus]